MLFISRGLPDIVLHEALNGGDVGMHGVWVDNRKDLENELTEAQDRDQATLMACRIGNRPYDGR